MPARRILLLLAVLLVFGAASAIVVRGVHGPSTEDAVLVAQQRWGMLCTAAGAQVDCVEPTGSDFPTRKAFIQPATGPLTSVVTRVNGLFTDRWVLQDADKAWMASMQVVGCADAKGVASFMDKVAAMADPAVPDSVPPQNVGECSLSATLESLRACGQPCYIVNSTLLPAAASPAPTPTPSPTTSPTALPTVTPPTGTATPTPRATASPSSTAPTPSPIVSGSPTATATPTATPSATPTATPTGDSSSAVATASPSPTPEQQVAGGNPTPSPSSDASGPVTRRGPGLFARSVPSVGGVSGDPVALGGSALLAILLVLFVAFPGELFNDTVESNFDEIAGWFRRGPIAYLGGVLAFLPRGPIAIALFVAVAAFLNALLDPGLGLDVASLATYLGFLVALVVTLIAFDGPPLFVHRRRTGELGSMRVLPWTLLIVAFFVVVSRVAALQPGYLYGIVLGIVFVREVGPRDEGREQAAGAAWTLSVALAAWLLLGLLRSTSPNGDAFGTVLTETALAAVMVAGIEAVALGLVPFRFLPGAAIYRWGRPAWAALFGLGTFGFVHVLIGPNFGYLSELSLAGLAAAAAAFVAFGVVSFLVWGYFRFRPARAA